MKKSIVISVDDLGKRYELGSTFSHHDTLRDQLVSRIRGLLPGARNTNGKANLKNKLEDKDGLRLDDDDNGEFWAARNISFDVEQGEVVGIIGRNGAGKSTLLKLLSRITEPTTGEIRLRGRVASLLEVGTGFHPELTGRENIFLNGAILGMSRQEIIRKFDEIVDFSGVSKFIDTPVKRYSSGMYVRLAFAVAAHLEPEILVVDEVLAVGDAGFQQKCLAKMDDVANQGRTVLFVSHNMAAIRNLCSRGICLDKGQVVADTDVNSAIETFMSTMAGDAQTSLRNRTDRKGKGEVRFTQIRYETDNGRPIDYGTSGQPLIIAFDYESSLSHLKNVRLSLTVNNHMGELYFPCVSSVSESGMLNAPPNGTFRCRIDNLPLSGGRYLLNVFLEVNKEVQDHVLAAAVLPVQDGDFFGTGKIYSPGWQGRGVLVPYRWHVGEPRALARTSSFE